MSSPRGTEACPGTPPGGRPAARPQGWHRQITRSQWRTLLAAQLGWMLDGMDVMLFAFALTAIKLEFGIGSGAAGALASLTLVASAAGGLIGGLVADRYGRTRALILSILAYSLFTGATAASRSVAELAIWRALVGLGLGGEWAAGAVLVAEDWPAEHRGKAIGLMQSGWAIGYLLAAALGALILPRWGWRPLFVVGVLPALLTFWIRRTISEPAIWREAIGRAPVAATSGDVLHGSGGGVAGTRGEATWMQIGRPPLRRLAVLATLLTSSVLFAYWGLFTWIPSYLANPVEQGGAGLGVVVSSAFIVPMQVGAFFGYSLFGFLADRFGRRPIFLLFVIGAGLLVPIYGLAGRHPTVLLLLGPLVGFFGHGYFSLFGAMLAEIFPSAIRCTAQGICFNAGRAVSALAPFTIGLAADRFGYGVALALTSALFLTAAVLITFLPETRGRDLRA
jgi:MFS family permease